MNAAIHHLGRLAFVALLTAGVSCSCADNGVHVMRASQSGFVRADISMVLNPDGAKEKRSTTVTDDELKHLLEFFPEAGEGKRSTAAGGWIAGATITLYRADGSTVLVKISAQYDAWSEGQGDWDLKPEFAPYMLKLLKGQPTTTTQGA